MKRYHVTFGAYTIAGGRVVSASGTSYVNDVAIALEGDHVACPSCKSPGYIVCTGPRTPEFEDGKPLALEGDFCVCGCVPPPRLIANQSLSFHTIEGHGTHEVSASESLESNQDEEIIEQFFEILDDHGSSVHGYKFDLLADDDVHEKAGHFAFGRTSVVRKDADARLVMWPRGDGGAYHG